MSTTNHIGYILGALLLCIALASAQHHHGNPDTNGNTDGEGGGAAMKYKDAGFQLGVRSDGYACEDNLMTPDGPNHHASHMVLERPQEWAYFHPFRLFFCGVTSVAPISYEMRFEIENKSIAQFSQSDGYNPVRTVNWVAHVCAEGNVDDPICWDKIRKTQAVLVCLESGTTKVNINFYFPGSGERAHTSFHILCKGTDYDRLYWQNPAWGHWLPGFGTFIGYTLILMLELGIIKANNYKTNNDVSTNKKGDKIKRISVESNDSNSGQDDPTGLDGVALDDNDDLIISHSRRDHSTGPLIRLLRRVKNMAKKTWMILGLENFILAATGLGLVIAHYPTGDTAWSDPFNLMHFMLGAAMLVMGLVGTLFNTNYMAKITFNFTVSLTLIMLGIMMNHHDQEDGLVGLVHNVFTYGIVLSGFFKMISNFLPTFKLLFILSGLWATFTLGLGAPSWMIAFTAMGLMDVTFAIFTGFICITWMCMWVLVGYLINKRRESIYYHSLNGGSIELQAL